MNVPFYLSCPLITRLLPQNIMSNLKPLGINKDAKVRLQAKQLLSICGVVSPCKGNGVRLLAIDGGGTRGIIAIRYKGTQY